MSQQIIQNCGTACCDCTVACKYHFIEDFCSQDTELFAHFIEVNNEHNLVIAFILGDGEIALMQRFVKFLQTNIKSIGIRYFEKYKQKTCKKAY
jgi:hypothetical protein